MKGSLYPKKSAKIYKFLDKVGESKNIYTFGKPYPDFSRLF